MVFSRGGEVNAPRRSHGLWAMAQYERFGLLDEAPPYLEIAESINLRDLYEEVADIEGLESPTTTWPPFRGATRRRHVRSRPSRRDRIVVMENPPGPSVREIIPVDLGRPRDRVTIVDDPAFRFVQKRLFDLLASEPGSAAAA